MNTLRQPTIGAQWVRPVEVVLVAAAILAAAWFVISALQPGEVAQPAVKAPQAAALSSPPSAAARLIGMGDVRLYEGLLARQSQPVGMGDVRRYEWLVTQQNRPIGMGDVRLFESTQRSE